MRQLAGHAPYPTPSTSHEEFGGASPVSLRPRTHLDLAARRPPHSGPSRSPSPHQAALLTVALPRRDARSRRRPGAPDDEATRTGTSGWVCASSGVGPPPRTRLKDGRGPRPAGLRQAGAGRMPRKTGLGRRTAPQARARSRRDRPPHGAPARPSSSAGRLIPPAVNRQAGDTSQGAGIMDQGSRRTRAVIHPWTGTETRGAPEPGSRTSTPSRRTCRSCRHRPSRTGTPNPGQGSRTSARAPGPVHISCTRRRIRTLGTPGSRTRSVERPSPQGQIPSAIRVAWVRWRRDRARTPR